MESGGRTTARRRSAHGDDDMVVVVVCLLLFVHGRRMLLVHVRRWGEVVVGVDGKFLWMREVAEGVVSTVTG